MSEEIINDLENEGSDVDLDDIDVGYTDADDDNQDTDDTDDTVDSGDDSDDDSDVDDSDDSGNVTLSKDEYNELMMNKRLLKKLSDEKETKDDTPAVAPTDPIEAVKAKYKDVDDKTIEVLKDVVEAITGKKLDAVVSVTSEQKIRSDVNEYASQNNLDAEKTKILTAVALNPDIKKLLETNTLSIEQVEYLAYGKDYKKAAVKDKIKEDNKTRKDDTHAETKRKGSSKKTSSDDTFTNDMSWDDFTAQAKNLGVSYDNES